MAYIDYSYYTSTFHGTIVAEAMFARLAEVASDVIDSIVSRPVNMLDESSDAFSKVKKACAYIVETLDANGGIDAITGFSASSVNSESLGDYSVSNGNSAGQSTGLWFGDIRIPQLAYALLQAAGLTSRWVYAGTVIDDGFQ